MRQRAAARYVRCFLSKHIEIISSNDVYVCVFCEPQMLLSKYFFLLSIIMKMNNKLYIHCILFTEVKRMTSLSCKWKQALPLLCVYSVAARRTAPHGTRRKTRKRNETCLRATMKGGTAKWLQLNEMEKKFPRRRKSIGYWYNKFVLQLEKRETLLEGGGQQFIKNWRHVERAWCV
jgi:hypothetical protein